VSAYTGLLERLSPHGWPDGITPGFVELGAAPNTGVGFQAPIGSIGKVGTSYYQKVGTAATDWSDGLGEQRWQDRITRRLRGLAGLQAGNIGVIEDDFLVGVGTDFTPQWTRAVLGGGGLTHGTGGAGTAVITNGSTDFATNSLAWRGPPVTLDTAATRWAIYFLLKWNTPPALVANVGAFFGISDGNIFGSNCYFGFNGSTDTTFCLLMVSGLTDLVLPYTFASFTAATEREVILVQTPSGANRAISAYVDGVLVGQTLMTAGLLAARAPWLMSNKGVVELDRMLMVFQKSF
jgi:hypothetical protein